MNVRKFNYEVGYLLDGRCFYITFPAFSLLNAYSIAVRFLTIETGLRCEIVSINLIED